MLNNKETAEELLKFFDDACNGDIEWDDHGGYTVTPFPETIDEVVDYAIKNIQPGIENNKLLFELADFHEEYDNPGVKFIPHTADYRLLNYDIENVFDGEDVIVSTPLADRISSHPGGLMYNTSSNNKIIKELKKDIVEVIATLKGTILVHGVFPGVSVALSKRPDTSNRCFFSGIPYDTVEHIRAYDDIYGKYFDNHYNTKNTSFDYVVVINGHVEATGHRVEFQFIGDDITSVGEGSDFSYRGINYPSCNGKGFLPVSLFLHTLTPYGKYVYVRGITPKYVPNYEPVSAAILTPMYLSIEDFDMVVKYIPVEDKRVPAGWYMVDDRSDKILFPLYYISFYNYLQVVSSYDNVAVWNTHCMSEKRLVLDKNGFFGKARNGILRDGISTIGLIGVDGESHKIKDSSQRDRWKQALNSCVVSDIYVRQEYYFNKNLIRFGVNRSFKYLYSFIDEYRRRRYCFSDYYLVLYKFNNQDVFDYKKERYIFLSKVKNIIYAYKYSASNVRILK